MSNYEICECCGAYMETKNSWGTIGGDGYGGRCCGEADVPLVVHCDDCGAAYCDGDRAPECDGVM